MVQALKKKDMIAALAIHSFDKKWLESLKSKELKALCKKHKVKTSLLSKGSMIDSLMASPFDLDCRTPRSDIF